jgi:hypothetical protein
VDFGKKYPALGINEVKDLDSLLEAAAERAAYAGNIILGNSGHVERSSSISDSFYMHNTSMLGDCKYCANCSRGRLCEDSFGTYGPGESEFCIRCNQTYRDKRCFEAWMTQNCADAYYSYNLKNCSDCFFCFNVRNKRHAIGNRELEKGKYLQIKEKLLGEIAGELRRKKRLPSLMDIVAECDYKKPAVRLEDDETEDDSGKKAAETSFQKTTKMVLGRQLSSIDQYGKWLRRHSDEIVELRSAASGKRILASPVCISLIQIPPERALTTPEALQLGKTTNISEEQADRFTLAGAHRAIGEIAFFNVEFTEGTSTHITECTTYIENSFCYRSAAMVYSKYCGYAFYPRSCEHVFGGDQFFDCSFCINCYYSVKLTRCFEMDSCRSCSDCYYCHNCEGLTDCMFCFNLKNKRNAVGNLELPADKYRSIKAGLLQQIAGELKSKKGVPSLIDIVGAAPLLRPKIRLANAAPEPKANMAPIEQEFAKTCELLFGARLVGKIDDYTAWLARRVRKSETHPSAARGKPVRRWDYCNYFLLPKERLLKQDEALAYGETEKISEAEAGELALASAGAVVGRLAFFSTEYEEGTNTNCVECPTPTQSANCYRTSPVVYSKYCAYSFWPRSCERMYGCNAMFDSEFCIHCYHSVKLKRCFEMDSCSECTGSYFCHNCENVHDSMFCFNTKNKRYAIGNVEVGRERFLEAKRMLLAALGRELAEKKSLALDIYNLGMPRKN